MYENIVLPIELDGKKIDKQFVQNILETLGLSYRQDALPSQLSGGQQQMADRIIRIEDGKIVTRN